MKVIILFVLAAMQLLQFSNAIGYDVTKTRLVPRSRIIFKPTKDMTEHDEITLFFEMVHNVKFIVQKFNILIKNVIEDAEYSEIYLNKELRELKDFVKKANKLDEFEGIELMDNLEDLREPLDTILEKNSEFRKRLDEYIDFLSPTEKCKVHKMVEWYNKFKAEPRVEKLMVLLNTFSDFIKC